MSAEGKAGREELECWQPGRQACGNAGKTMRSALLLSPRERITTNYTW